MDSNILALLTKRQRKTSGDLGFYILDNCKHCFGMVA